MHTMGDSAPRALPSSSCDVRAIEASPQQRVRSRHLSIHFVLRTSEKQFRFELHHPHHIAGRQYILRSASVGAYEQSFKVTVDTQYIRCHISGCGATPYMARVLRSLPLHTMSGELSAAGLVQHAFRDMRRAKTSFASMRDNAGQRVVIFSSVSWEHMNTLRSRCAAGPLISCSQTHRHCSAPMKPRGCSCSVPQRALERTAGRLGCCFAKLLAV